MTVAVRAPGALERPFWQDEVASARVIVEPTGTGMLAHVRQTESTPPAWYALAWLVHRAGISVADLRLLSVAFSALLAVLVVLAARRLLPLWAATLAGALVALGWQFVFHGSELRAYALLALLAAVFALLLERAALAPTRRRLAALAAGVALGAMTHYFFLLTALAGLAWLWTGPRRPSRARVTAAVAAGLAPLAAWTPALAHQYAAGRFDWIGRFDLLKAAGVYSAMFFDPGSLYSTVGAASEPAAVAGRLVVGAVVVWGFVALARRSERGRLFACLGTVPVLVAAVVWLAGPRVFDARNLIVVGPFAAVAVAAAVVSLPRGVALAGGLAAVSIAALGLALAGLAPTPPYDRVAQALVAEGWRPGDPVILLGNATALRSPVAWYLGEALGSDEAGPHRAGVYLVGERWRRRRARSLFGAIGSERLVRPFVVARLRGDPVALRAEARRRKLLGPVAPLS